jgi:glycosyltransferase involved in cell wall biosynthesis
MASPFFSILMPLYNHADYVGQAIESVLAQTEGDFELVICNDGSTDHSAEVVARYKDPRIVFLSKPNGGTTSALNACLLLSQGRYICWLSADDLYEPSKLALHRQWHEPHGGDVSVAPYGVIKDGVSYGATQRVFHGRERVLPFLNMNYINGLSICISREMFAKAGVFNPVFRYAQDVDRWISVLRHVQPQYLSGPPMSYSSLGTGHLANFNSDLNGFLDVFKINAFMAASGFEGYLPFESRANRDDQAWLLQALLAQHTSANNNVFYRFGMQTVFLKAVANFAKRFGFIEQVEGTYAPLISSPAERDQVLAFCRGENTDISQVDFYKHLDLLIASPSVDQKIKDTIVFYKKTTLS